MAREKEQHSSRDIYGDLKAMINNLEILPGTRVTENQLADYFAVSRTPIRAALHKLEIDNLLVIKPKQGCFIRNIDMALISSYYDVRVTLENMVLAEVTRQHDMSGLDRLKKDWDPDYYRYGVKVTDKLKLAEEDFHMRLSELSGNPALQNYIADINNKIRCVRLLGWPDRNSVIKTYVEHYRICELLLAGDIVTAQAEMTVHIRKSQEQASKLTLNQLYKNRNFISFE